MNHYPHHLGDYAKDTLGFTMLEHGAYRLILDAYYANEQAPEADDVHSIAKAGSAAERKAVAKVLKKFQLRDGRYYHKRVEQELEAFRARSKSAAESANVRWERHAKKDAKVDAEKMRTHMPTHTETHSERIAGAMLASSHKPEETKPTPEKRYHGRETTGDSAAAFAAASMKKLHPPGPEATVATEDGTPAGMLAAILLRNSIKATAFHPLVVDWARDGVTIEGIRAAIATARLRKPAPENIPLAYLDTILADKSKPVDSSWKRDDVKAAALCSELGIPGPKVGEQTPQFHSRIEQALAQRARSQVQ